MILHMYLKRNNPAWVMFRRLPYKKINKFASHLRALKRSRRAWGDDGCLNRLFFPSLFGNINLTKVIPEPPPLRKKERWQMAQSRQHFVPCQWWGMPQPTAFLCHQSILHHLPSAKTEIAIHQIEDLEKDVKDITLFLTLACGTWKPVPEGSRGTGHKSPQGALHLQWFCSEVHHNCDDESICFSVDFRGHGEKKKL